MQENTVHHKKRDFKSSTVFRFEIVYPANMTYMSYKKKTKIRRNEERDVFKTSREDEDSIQLGISRLAFMSQLYAKMYQRAQHVSRFRLKSTNVLSMSHVLT
jgi:hypothetical protein